MVTNAPVSLTDRGFLFNFPRLMNIAAIITTAGQGKRMGGDKPKQYLDIAGRPIIVHTLERFAEVQRLGHLIVVVPPADANSFKNDILERYGFPGHWRVVAGGAARQDSVMNGLTALPDDVDVILVHDGVRPFIDPEIIEKSIDAAAEFGACVVAMPLKETIKRVGDENTVSETIDRRVLWGAQTPQTFKASLLREAYESAFRDKVVGTDEAMLVERIGHKVKVIKGDYRNIKITTTDDLVLAEAIAAHWGK